MSFFTTQELLQIPSPPWLIYKVLPGYGVALLYGAPETGKSFIAIDWALCVATGSEWRDFPVKRGHVVYVASEGGEGIKKRVAAWLHHRGIEDAPDIMWFLDTLDFRDQDEIDGFVASLEGRYPGKQVYAGEGQFVTTGGLALRLVVVDTLACNFGAEDENSFEAMQPFINTMKTFSEKTGALVLLVHHTNALGTRERGHSSLRGAINVSFEAVCERNETNQMTEVILRNDKQKDDARQSGLVFVPRVYPLPMLPLDEQGEELSTLVLEPRVYRQKVQGTINEVIDYVRGHTGSSQDDIVKGLAYLPGMRVRKAVKLATNQGAIVLDSVSAHGRHCYKLPPHKK